MAKIAKDSPMAAVSGKLGTLIFKQVKGQTIITRAPAKPRKESEKQNSEDKTKEILAKTLADFDNYKKRVERDKKDMIFFLKADILKNILPRIDDIERIIKNTPDDLKRNGLFEGILSLEKKLLTDLEKL